MVIEDPLTRAANAEFSGGSGLGPVPRHAWGLKSGAVHTAVEPLLAGALPYYQMANRGLGEVYKALPAGTAPTTTQILVDLLRSRATPYAQMVTP